MGHAYKIVPMLVWQARYRSLPSDEAPLLTDMYSHGLARLSLTAYAFGFAATAAGIASGEVDILRTGAACALAGAAGFSLNMVLVLAGALRRRLETAAPVAAGLQARSGS
jgi:hypothetical protein